MLISNFDVFVNFTAANSRFLRPLHKRKPLFRGENWPTWTLPCRFETQMIPSSQSRIPRWQNTIFSFLEAQLDFLAIFSKPPIITTKYGILINLSEFIKLSKYYNYLLFIGILARIIGSKPPYSALLEKHAKTQISSILAILGRKRLRTAKKRLFDQNLQILLTE